MNDELVTILKKVRQLYRKYGIQSVTMDDVSHELGISKKTLYQYVQDKDDLVHKVVEWKFLTGRKEWILPAVMTKMPLNSFWRLPDVSDYAERLQFSYRNMI